MTAAGALLCHRTTALGLSAGPPPRLLRPDLPRNRLPLPVILHDLNSYPCSAPIPHCCPLILLHPPGASSVRSGHSNSPHGSSEWRASLAFLAAFHLVLSQMIIAHCTSGLGLARVLLLFTVISRLYFHSLLHSLRFSEAHTIQPYHLPLFYQLLISPTRPHSSPSLFLKSLTSTEMTKSRPQLLVCSLHQ